MTTDQEFYQAVQQRLSQGQPLPEQQLYRFRKNMEESLKTTQVLLAAKMEKLDVKPGQVVVFSVDDDDIDPQVLGQLKAMFNRLAGGDVGLLALRDGMEVSVKDRDEVIAQLMQLPTGE